MHLYYPADPAGCMSDTYCVIGLSVVQEWRYIVRRHRSAPLRMFYIETDLHNDGQLDNGAYDMD